MDINEYIKKYENFKKLTIGKYIDYDGVYSYQCFDLVNKYVYEVLELGWSLNPLYYNFNLQDKYKEVSTEEMISGDICIWQGEHICIFDHYDGDKTWYLSQDNSEGALKRPTGVYSNVTSSKLTMRAVRPIKVKDVIEVIPVVKKNEKHDQLEIIIDQLMVRSDTVINDDNIIGIAKGIYNYYEIKEIDDYIWYRIGDDQWILYDKQSIILFPKKPELIEDDPIVIPPKKKSIFDIISNFIKRIISFLRGGK
ncbi:MAG: hypothetical protein PHU94_01105 [Bacilli bacterium]|nr:hypothetical protein [Bacilli bacterium]MDD4733308.1 hypothetical protein [Bacilli bacterium]